VRRAGRSAGSGSGVIISPDGLSNQIEGGIIQGTSWTLKDWLAVDTSDLVSDGAPAVSATGCPDAATRTQILVDNPTRMYWGTS